jgi:biopolymer transport protein ExbB
MSGQSKASQLTAPSRAIAFAVALTLLPLAPAAVAQEQPAATSVTPAQTQQAPAGETKESEPAPATSLRSISVGLKELSPWSMFLSATVVVQAIMAALAFASVVTWTIAIGKAGELFLVNRRLSKALRAVNASRTLREAATSLASDRTVMRSLMAAALNEIHLTNDFGSEQGIKERAESSFSEITRTEARRIRIGMGVIATIAATSPFVGLFGTVWGIMNSFIGISKAQTTNLAVVAPGIAEALLATAIGLFAAIPAVMIYNHFSRMTKGYLELVGRAAGAVGRQLSRDLDHAQPNSLRAAAE